MVDMADRADIQVRLRPLKLLACHCRENSLLFNENDPTQDGSFSLLTVLCRVEPLTGLEPVTSSLPKRCSAN
jgi:hypothetical protein